MSWNTAWLAEMRRSGLFVVIKDFRLTLLPDFRGISPQITGTTRLREEAIASLEPRDCPGYRYTCTDHHDRQSQGLRRNSN
jgi:hypothetical protein